MQAILTGRFKILLFFSIEEGIEKWKIIVLGDGLVCYRLVLREIFGRKRLLLLFVGETNLGSANPRRPRAVGRIITGMAMQLFGRQTVLGPCHGASGFLGSL